MVWLSSLMAKLSFKKKNYSFYHIPNNLIILLSTDFYSKPFFKSDDL